MRATLDYNLGKLHTELSRAWHSLNNGKLTLFEVTPRSRRKVWWICSQGHEWAVGVYNRTSKR